MERESNQMQAYCRSGCGFYGSPATDGLCSICYKEALKKKQQPPVATPSPATTVTSPSLSSLMETATAQPTVTSYIPSTPASDLSASDSSMSEGNLPINNKKCENENKYTTGTTGPEDDEEVTAAGPQNIENTPANDFQSPTTTNNNNDTNSSAVTEEQQQQQGADAIAAGEEATSATGGAEASTENDSSDKDDKDAKKKKNRCAVCRKKVGLTGFQCRCGGLFCAVHRYSDKHNCSFNYREMGAEEIRRNNPVVVGEKIQKI